MVLVSPDSERNYATTLGITAELSAEQIDFEPLKMLNGFILKVIFIYKHYCTCCSQTSLGNARANQVKIALTLSDPACCAICEGLNELLDDKCRFTLL